MHCIVLHSITRNSKQLFRSHPVQATYVSFLRRHLCSSQPYHCWEILLDQMDRHFWV